VCANRESFEQDYATIPDVALGGQMSTLLLEQAEIELRRGDLWKLPDGKTRMYAIAFDLDTAQLQKVYPTPSYTNAYGDIRKVLEPFGFNWQQGSVYFGDEEMNAVKCVLAAQAVSNAYPWFKSCVRDIRMLRIEELNDLAPAL
jgi:virulence-associated protein VapD